MTPRRLVFALVGSLLVASVGGTASPDPDERVLLEARMNCGTPALVAMLNRLSADDMQLAQGEEQIGRLGSPRFAERESAAKALMALGPSAVPALQQAAASDDPEVRRAARRCLEQIGPTPPPAHIRAAVRLLVKRNAPDTLPVLLRYLPSVTDDEVEEEIAFGLDELTQRAGGVAAELVTALTDRQPKRRAIAGCIIAHRGTPSQRAEAKKLLSDADAAVRLRCAQGLLAAMDASGLPMLIELLSIAPREIAWQAEELLRYAAGPHAPPELIGDGSSQRRTACRLAWIAVAVNGGLRLDAAAMKDRWPLLIAAVGEENKADRSLTLTPAYRDKVAWLYGSDGTQRWRRPTGEEGITPEWKPAGFQRLDQEGLKHHAMLSWPRVSRLVPLRSGLLFAEDAERLLITDQAGRTKWALFYPPHYAHASCMIFGLLQLGFAPPWSTERDLAETVAFRRRSLQTVRPEIRHREEQWFAAQLLVNLDRWLGLRLGPDRIADPPAGGRVLDPSDLCSLLRAAGDPWPPVRKKVAELLGEGWADEAPTVTPTLAHLTRDPDPEVRFAAICALGRMQRSSTFTCQVLAELIEAGDPRDRVTALGTIQRLGPHAAPLVDVVIKCFADKSEEVRRWVGSSLAYIGNGDARVVQFYANLLRESKTRNTGALGLNQIPLSARTVGSALLESLFLPIDPCEQRISTSIRVNILWTIRRLALDPEVAVNPLLRCIGDQQMELDVRCAAAAIFADADPAWCVALPRLRAMLKNSTNPSVMNAILMAIESLEKKKIDAIQDK